jgi:hypothetical protein
VVRDAVAQAVIEQELFDRRTGPGPRLAAVNLT